MIAAVAVAVLSYVLLAPQDGSGDTSTDHNGMWGPHSTYNSGNVTLVMVSVVAIVASVMVVAFWREYEPLPPTMTQTTKGELSRPERKEGSPGSATCAMEEDAAHNYLVLRLLSGDERTMYKVLMDSGGEALQKDLMAKARMSNAKVSRVLDRLSAKGIITKERYGSTNRVRIKLDQ